MLMDTYLYTYPIHIGKYLYVCKKKKINKKIKRKHMKICKVLFPESLGREVNNVFSHRF